MSRIDEINAKHALLRDLMAQHNAPAIQLNRTRNIAWFTAGADASIPVETDYGAYSVVVTPEKRIIYTSNIEATRIRAEEKLEDLGFELSVVDWYLPRTETIPGIVPDEGAVLAAIAVLRANLTPQEQVRLRLLGKDAGNAIEQAARAVQPGDSEWVIAARLDAACRARGGVAIVNLIATDERISKFRHPLITAKEADKYVMIVLCMRRGGLIVSATRLVYFGEVPSDLQEKNRKVATIDAAVMAATRPGRTCGDIFSDLQAAYAAQGEPDQWQYHHQGGLGGYAPRERIVTPGDPTIVRAGQTYAWNPSIVGCKSEDSILVTENDFEIVCHTGNWDYINVDVGGKSVPRPAILSL